MSDSRSALVELLFQQAADLPEADRAEFLDTRCAGDLGLRRDIETLLRHASLANDAFLCGPRRDGAATGAANRLLPSRIGRYAILRKLGEGGMGIVYEARQEKPNRTVALKVIRSPLVSEGLLRRFQHEADVLGRLQHPGIACVHEAGVGEVLHAGDDRPSGEAPFLAMEFVPGLPLTEFARRVELPARERLSLFADVCDAVHYAHEQGVVHRDLKPANILVVSTPGSDGHARPLVKILDFGVARLTHSDIQSVTVQTDAGQLIGTVPYMSPEQVAGDSRVLDARSDVYALGVVLFELLAGRLPYDLRNRVLPDVLRVIREDEPSRLGSVDATFRGDVETIVAKAMEKEPQRRYPSAAALAGDIRRYLADLPIVARRATATYQLRKFARRNKALVSVIALAFALVTGGLVGLSILAVRLADERDLARQRGDESRRAAYRANLSAALAAIAKSDAPSAMRALLDTPEDLRGLEWRHLWFRTDPSVFRFHADPTQLGVSASLSQDGRHVAALGHDRILRWRDASNGNTLGDFGPLPAGVDHVTMLPDGRRALLSYRNGNLEMRDLIQSRSLWALNDRGSLWPASLSPDGRIVAASTREDQAVMLVDSDSGRLLKIIDAACQLPIPTFSPDGRWLALTDRILTLYDLTSERIHWQRESPYARLCAFSPDGGSVIEVKRLDSGGQMSLLDTATGEALVTCGLDWIPGVVNVAWRPDARVVAVMNRASTVIEIRDSTSLNLLSTFCGPEPIHDLRYHADGERLVGVGGSGLVVSWPAQALAVPFHFDSMHPAYAASISEGGDRAALVGWGVVSLLNPHTSELLWMRNVSIATLNAVAICPDGRLVAADGGVGTVVFLSAATGEFISRTPRDRLRDVLSLDWTPDGSGVIAGFDDGLVCEVRVDAPELRRRTFEGPRRAVRGLRVDRNSRRLAAVTDAAFVGRRGSRIRPETKDDSIFVWNLDDARLLWSHHGHEGRATCASFGADGMTLATGGAGGRVLLWDSTNGDPVGSLGGTTAETRSLAFSRDGQRVAAGAINGRLHLWDAKAHSEVAVFPIGSSLAVSFRESEPGLIAIDAEFNGITVLDTAPLAPEVLAQRDRLCRAWNTIIPLLRTPSTELGYLSDAMIDSVEKTPRLDAEIREAAVTLLRRRGDHAASCNSIAWGMVLSRYSPPENHRIGLKLAEAAARALPDYVSILNTLGVAQYRLNQLEEARRNFQRCVALAVQERGAPAASDVLFLAMTEQRLGNPSEAARQLEIGRGLLSGAGVTVNDDDRRILEESESLFSQPAP